VSRPKLPARWLKQIAAAVAVYKKHRTDFSNLAEKVHNDLIRNRDLKKLIHSAKFREKDPDHLRDKLRRKAFEARDQGKPFRITEQNIFAEIDDLAGVRLLHIYREQLKEIDPIIRAIFRKYEYTFREKPKAYTWDIENQQFYKALGFRVEANPKFYTSVHYVIRPHYENVGCEIQVRTLAEELWGEVSHEINYPHPSKCNSCREQLAVLARSASGCTRLVDSIFATKKEFSKLKARKR